MKKTKNDPITMDDYNFYPWWFEVTALRTAIDRGEIHHIELVKTTHNTTGHRLYKITTNIGNAYTVKIQTTFKATPLENFINSIINGMAVKKDIDLTRYAYVRRNGIPPRRDSYITYTAQQPRRKGEDPLYDAWMDGYHEGMADLLKTLKDAKEKYKEENT